MFQFKNIITDALPSDQSMDLFYTRSYIYLNKVPKSQYYFLSLLSELTCRR